MSPYEALLPKWHAYCAEREWVRSEKDPDADWLYTVGARERMADAYRNWLHAIENVCGVGTRVEWPNHKDSFFDTYESFRGGSCVVAGLMLFTDPLDVFEGRTKRVAK